VWLVCAGTLCQLGPVISSVSLSDVSAGVKQVSWSSTGSLSTVLIKVCCCCCLLLLLLLLPADCIPLTCLCCVVWCGVV
jgi:hypothetical protein